MKLSDKLKQHQDLIDDKLRGLYKVHEGPAGGFIFTQHEDGTYVECWTHDEPREMSWNEVQKLLQTLNRGGYNDWSLPTKNELDKMFDNKDQIGKFQNAWYWSDTEEKEDEFRAWLQNFSTGDQTNFFKSLYSRVRAVRRFK